MSVVTAHFNAGSEVFETASCVLAQTLTSWEWIIVDDGSTDASSIARLDALERLDDRVRVIRAGANGGPGAARNRGVDAAVAPVVFFLDADDLIEPTMLEHVAWHLATRPDAAAASTYEIGFGAQRYLWSQGFDVPQLLLRECPVGAHAVAVRTAVFREIGGFDETIRGGMEDWDLWFRLASKGHWGSTIPEYLSWYRRREDHSTRWADWDGGERQARFREGLKRRHPGVFERPPVALRAEELSFGAAGGDPPVRHEMAKSSPRVLVIVARMTMSGGDKHVLNVLRRLRERGWEATVVAIEGGDSWWRHEYAGVTTDVSRARSFVRGCDVPRLVRGMIESRRPDVVLMSESEAGYAMLPYLRAKCPQPAYVDLVHRVEASWRNGGHPRHSAASRGWLDLTLTSSRRVRDWMTARGDDGDRIRVCPVGDDPAAWGPHRGARDAMRREWSVEGDTPVILCAARLSDEIRPAVFAAAINALASRGVEFRVVVAGDGVARGVLERELGGLIERGVVRLVGTLANERVLAACRGADVFFLPRAIEGPSSAVREAMGAGLAVVTADTPAQRELVTPGCGVLVGGVGEPGEAEAYASALETLCRRHDQRRAMGLAARARIEAMGTAAAQAERVEGALRAAMERRSRRSEFVVSDAMADELATRAVEFSRLQALADELWVENANLRAQGPRMVVHWPGLWPVTMGVLGRLWLIARSTPAWVRSVAARAFGRQGRERN
ncbi:MAG: hypothetical protein RL689_1319 [Planctomycetota bacterium]